MQLNSLIALVLLGTIPGTTLIAGDHFIQIKGEANVQIFLDDDFKGITEEGAGGIVLTNIEAGEHQIRAFKTGHPAQHFTINLGEEKLSTIILAPFHDSDSTHNLTVKDPLEAYKRPELFDILEEVLPKSDRKQYTVFHSNKWNGKPFRKKVELEEHNVSYRVVSTSAMPYYLLEIYLYNSLQRAFPIYDRQNKSFIGGECKLERTRKNVRAQWDANGNIEFLILEGEMH
ncbi:MAG: hypothetical protein AB3N10_02035 [Allomuricauda sp.]